MLENAAAPPGMHAEVLDHDREIGERLQNYERNHEEAVREERREDTDENSEK